MSVEIVVYYYADPAFHGDLRPALDDLRRRGHRVVKGDNADELLFLLQVGRPVAVIYTLATANSAATTAYQLISRRTLDLLVPLILVGPEDPRDGVSLLYPEGRNISRHHVPFHALASLIERFAETPPGTPSRPPEMLQNKTLGRGRTVLNWQAAAADARRAELPDTSDIHGAPQGSVLPSRPAPLPPQPPPDNKTIRMLAPGAAAPGGSTPSQPPAPAPVHVPSGKRTLIAGSVPPPRPEDAPSPGPPPAEATPPEADAVPSAAGATHAGDGRGPALILVVVFGLLAILGAVGIAIWLATRPGAPPPQPILAGPPAVTTAPRGQAAFASEPRVLPTVEEEPGGEIERPAGATPVTTAPPRAVPTAAPATGAVEPFPAHFREDAALFWFDDDVARDTFLARIGAWEPTSTLRLTGHATEGEVAAGRSSLGLSRAWAVRKWLIRKGIEAERIETARGRNVPDRGPRDARGLELNNWVDISVE